MSTQDIVSNASSSKKEYLRKFSWKEFFILVAASLFGAVASLPTAWSTIVETAAKANIPVQSYEVPAAISNSHVGRDPCFGNHIRIGTSPGNSGD